MNPAEVTSGGPPVFEPGVPLYYGSIPSPHLVSHSHHVLHQQLPPQQLYHVQPAMRGMQVYSGVPIMFPPGCSMPVHHPQSHPGASIHKQPRFWPVAPVEGFHHLGHLRPPMPAHSLLQPPLNQTQPRCSVPQLTHSLLQIPHNLPQTPSSTISPGRPVWSTAVTPPSPYQCSTATFGHTSSPQNQHLHYDSGDNSTILSTTDNFMKAACYHGIVIEKPSGSQENKVQTTTNDNHEFPFQTPSNHNKEVQTYPNLNSPVSNSDSDRFASGFNQLQGEVNVMESERPLPDNNSSEMNNQEDWDFHQHVGDKQRKQSEVSVVNTGLRAEIVRKELQNPKQVNQCDVESILKQLREIPYHKTCKKEFDSDLKARGSGSELRATGAGVNCMESEERFVEKLVMDKVEDDSKDDEIEGWDEDELSDDSVDIIEHEFVTCMSNASSDDEDAEYDSLNSKEEEFEGKIIENQFVDKVDEFDKDIEKDDVLCTDSRDEGMGKSVNSEEAEESQSGGREKSWVNGDEESIIKNDDNMNIEFVASASRNGNMQDNVCETAEVSDVDIVKVVDIAEGIEEKIDSKKTVNTTDIAPMKLIDGTDKECVENEPASMPALPKSPVKKLQESLLGFTNRCLQEKNVTIEAVAEAVVQDAIHEGTHSYVSLFQEGKENGVKETQALQPEEQDNINYSSNKNIQLDEIFSMETIANKQQQNKLTREMKDDCDNKQPAARTIPTDKLGKENEKKVTELYDASIENMDDNVSETESVSSEDDTLKTRPDGSAVNEQKMAKTNDKVEMCNFADIWNQNLSNNVYDYTNPCQEMVYEHSERSHETVNQPNNASNWLDDNENYWSVTDYGHSELLEDDASLNEENPNHEMIISSSRKKPEDIEKLLFKTQAQLHGISIVNPNEGEITDQQQYLEKGVHQNTKNIWPNRRNSWTFERKLSVPIQYSDGNESDAFHSMDENSVDDAKEAFRIKASMHGIRIQDPNDVSIESEVESDLSFSSGHIRHSSIASTDSDLLYRTALNSDSVDSGTSWTRGRTILNVDAPEFNGSIASTTGSSCSERQDWGMRAEAQEFMPSSLKYSQRQATLKADATTSFPSSVRAIGSQAENENCNNSSSANTNEYLNHQGSTWEVCGSSDASNTKVSKSTTSVFRERSRPTFHSINKPRKNHSMTKSVQTSSEIKKETSENQTYCMKCYSSGAKSNWNTREVAINTDEGMCEQDRLYNWNKAAPLPNPGKCFKSSLTQTDPTYQRSVGINVRPRESMMKEVELQKSQNSQFKQQARVEQLAEMFIQMNLEVQHYKKALAETSGHGTEGSGDSNFKHSPSALLQQTRNQQEKMFNALGEKLNSVNLLIQELLVKTASRGSNPESVSDYQPIITSCKASVNNLQTQMKERSMEDVEDDDSETEDQILQHSNLTADTSKHPVNHFKNVSADVINGTSDLVDNSLSETGKPYFSKTLTATDELYGGQSLSEAGDFNQLILSEYVKAELTSSPGSNIARGDSLFSGNPNKPQQERNHIGSDADRMTVHLLDSIDSDEELEKAAIGTCAKKSAALQVNTSHSYQRVEDNNTDVSKKVRNLFEEMYDSAEESGKELFISPPAEAAQEFFNKDFDQDHFLNQEQATFNKHGLPSEDTSAKQYFPEGNMCVDVSDEEKGFMAYRVNGFGCDEDVPAARQSAIDFKPFNEAQHSMRSLNLSKDKTVEGEQVLDVIGNASQTMEDNAYMKNNSVDKIKELSQPKVDVADKKMGAAPVNSNTVDVDISEISLQLKGMKLESPSKNKMADIQANVTKSVNEPLLQRDVTSQTKSFAKTLTSPQPKGNAQFFSSPPGPSQGSFAKSPVYLKESVLTPNVVDMSNNATAFKIVGKAADSYKESVMSLTSVKNSVQTEATVGTNVAKSQQVKEPAVPHTPSSVTTAAPSVKPAEQTNAEIDPALFQAVLAQLSKAYPELDSDQEMLAKVAIQQTKILQMYVNIGATPGATGANLGTALSQNPGQGSITAGFDNLGSSLGPQTSGNVGSASNMLGYSSNIVGDSSNILAGSNSVFTNSTSAGVYALNSNLSGSPYDINKHLNDGVNGIHKASSDPLTQGHISSTSSQTLSSRGFGSRQSPSLDILLGSAGSSSSLSQPMMNNQKSMIPLGKNIGREHLSQISPENYEETSHFTSISSLSADLHNSQAGPSLSSVDMGVSNLSRSTTSQSSPQLPHTTQASTLRPPITQDLPAVTFAKSTSNCVATLHSSNVASTVASLTYLPPSTGYHNSKTKAKTSSQAVQLGNDTPEDFSDQTQGVVCTSLKSLPSHNYSAQDHSTELASSEVDSPASRAASQNETFQFKAVSSSSTVSSTKPKSPSDNPFESIVTQGGKNNSASAHTARRIPQSRQTANKIPQTNTGAAVNGVKTDFSEVQSSRDSIGQQKYVIPALRKSDQSQQHSSSHSWRENSSEKSSNQPPRSQKTISQASSDCHLSQPSYPHSPTNTRNKQSSTIDSGISIHPSEDWESEVDLFTPNIVVTCFNRSRLKTPSPTMEAQPKPSRSIVPGLALKQSAGGSRKKLGMLTVKDGGADRICEISPPEKRKTPESGEDEWCKVQSKKRQATKEQPCKEIKNPSNETKNPKPTMTAPVKVTQPSNPSQKMSNFERLVAKMQSAIPNTDRQMIIESITHLRQMRGSLSGLTMEVIIAKCRTYIQSKSALGTNARRTGSPTVGITNQPQQSLPKPVPQKSTISNVKKSSINHQQSPINTPQKPVMPMPQKPEKTTPIKQTSTVLMMPNKFSSLSPQSETDEDNVCVICFEPLTSLTMKELDCLHVFHQKCISQWVERERTCPTCRQHALFPEDFPRL